MGSNGSFGLSTSDALNGSNDIYSQNFECYGASSEEMEAYEKISYWMEVGVQPIFGIAGFIANAIAIPVLCSPNLKSIFNRLLACLAVYDNAYIVLSITEAFRRHFGSSTVHSYAFCYFLFPLHNIILSCTIFVPIALALERFRAIRHPVEYHNWQAGHNPWKKVLKSYIIPLNAFALLLCLPKFFESTVQWETVIEYLENGTAVNNSVAQIQSTDLRFDETYVLWYINVTRLCVTGIGPFLALVMLNLNIFLVIRRRRVMTPRLQNVQSAALKDEAAKQSYVLFAICGLFLLCHILRLILAIHEFAVLDEYRKSLELGCFAVKFWTLVTATVSHLLLTFNSSINFVVYCMMSTEFRKILKDWIHANLMKRFGCQDCFDVETQDNDVIENNSCVIHANFTRASLHSRSVNGIIDEDSIEASHHITRQAIETSDGSFQGSLLSLPWLPKWIMIPLKHCWRKRDENIPKIEVTETPL